jgi:hypothetical protein
VWKHNLAVTRRGNPANDLRLPFAVAIAWLSEPGPLELLEDFQEK